VKALSKRLFEHVSRNASRLAEKTLHGPAGAGLTCRQRQLMQLVAKGMTNKEIAMNLKVSEYTVKNHLSRIMAQLREENRHQAVDVMRAGGYSLSA
jgi:DNA-binding NarL/FixJ family response regulator